MGLPAVSASAQLACSMGTAPGALGVLPTARVFTEGPPAATIADTAPFVNIPPFGMCRSLGNPSVAAATSAAGGVLTPQACLPATGPPWTPGAPRTLIGGMPALTAASTCMCSYGGVVSITYPATVKTTQA